MAGCKTHTNTNTLTNTNKFVRWTWSGMKETNYLRALNAKHYVHIVQTSYSFQLWQNFVGGVKLRLSNLETALPVTHAKFKLRISCGFNNAVWHR